MTNQGGTETGDLKCARKRQHPCVLRIPKMTVNIIDGGMAYKRSV